MNKRVRVGERIVLPRIADACTDALDLLRETGDARLDMLGRASSSLKFCSTLACAES